jgi:transposase
MDRFSLTDAQWEKMGPFCFGKPTDPGRTGGDNRLFVEAVLWIARTGSPWRDLPPLSGKSRKWPRAISRGTRCLSASATG